MYKLYVDGHFICDVKNKQAAKDYLDGIGFYCPNAHLRQNNNFIGWVYAR